MSKRAGMIVINTEPLVDEPNRRSSKCNIYTRSDAFHGELSRLVVAELGRRWASLIQDRFLEAITERAMDLDWTRDVFDRLIVAQAALDGAPLVTTDRSDPQTLSESGVVIGSRLPARSGSLADRAVAAHFAVSRREGDRQHARVINTLRTDHSRASPRRSRCSPPRRGSPAHRGCTDGPPRPRRPRSACPRSRPSVDRRDYGAATILPGLVDAHTHLVAPGDGTLGDDVERRVDDILLLQAAKNARTLLHSGVTTLRENGAKGKVAFSLREGIRRPAPPGTAHGHLRATRHDHRRAHGLLRLGGGRRGGRARRGAGSSSRKAPTTSRSSRAAARRARPIPTAPPTPWPSWRR